MKKKLPRILLPIFIVAMLLCSLVVIAFATGETEGSYPDAMVDILADATLSQYKIEEVHYEDEGYLNIPVDVTLYFDAEEFEISYKYGNKGGTTMVIYVVNTRTERAGTDSDVTIIQSMIDRGYAVAVVDYHHHKKTVPDDIEWSTQKIANTLIQANQYKSPVLNSTDSFKEAIIVPAGHNLTRDIVYWEYDLHGVDGSLEYIVDVWNHDFRGVKGSIIIPWHNEGVRKATQKGFDGTSPVWYSPTTDKTAAGVVSSNGAYYVPDESGLYLMVKHTLAEEITDCVQLDGTPIDLNLYMFIVYPTNPVEPVPTMALQSSSENTYAGAMKDGRPHSYAFAFEGYAVAVFDYAYTPMARNDHYGYFDGSSFDKGSVTGDNRTYSLHVYNNIYVSTASLRCVRYLAASQPETYKLDGNIGLIGNSKGSIITRMADLDLNHTRSLADGFSTVEELEKYAYIYISEFEHEYYLSNNDGKTRYDLGHETYVKDGATIDGGEIQPWLTYGGQMLPSGAQFVYSCCGSRISGVDENYAPVMTTGHVELETTAYAANGAFYNYMREYDLVSLYFELTLGHMFLQRECDMLGIDPYVCYKDFVNYVLKGDAATVLYTTPLMGSQISTTSAITVKFSGSIPTSEIAKVTLTDKDGNAVLGSFEGGFGGTEWTFTPTAALRPNTEYTLSVPETVKDEKGNSLERTEITFYTEDGATEDLHTSGTLSATAGQTLSLTVPDLTAYRSAGVNRATLSFVVTNDAANRLEIYENNQSGAPVASIPIGGAGTYLCDITELLASKAPGSTLTLYIRSAKAAGASANSALSFMDFDEGRTANLKLNSGSTLVDYEGHGKVVRAAVLPLCSEYVPTHMYYNPSAMFEIRNILPTMSAADVGRRFVVTFEVYDTVSRMISLSGGSLSNASTGIVDYDRDVKNFQSVAGEWQTVSFELTVDEPLYGKNGYRAKGISISMYSTGNSEAPVYFDNFRIEEITTDVTVGGVSLVLSNAGGTPYKQGISTAPFSVAGVNYATLKEAIAALGTEGGTVTLLNNVTLTDSDVLTNVKASAIVLDLNGYEIRTDIQSTSLISPIDGTCTAYTLKNGSVYLSGGALLGFESSKAQADVTVNAENLFIGTEPGATTRQLLVNTEAKYTSSVKLVLKNSTVAVDYENCTKNPVVMLPASNDTLHIFTEMHGGTILTDNVHSVTLLESFKEIRLYPYESTYTTFYLTSALTFEEMVLSTDKALCPLEKNTEITAPLGYTAYTLLLSENSTPYGVIPEEYRDAELYPFVVFNTDTNAFVGASAVFSADDATSATGMLTDGSGSTGNFAIYLRRDATHETASYNLGKINGTLIVDLGGHTLSYTASINVQFKYNGFKETITFTNGTLYASSTKSSLPFMLTSYGSKNGQTISVIFDGITFRTVSGFVSPYWVSAGSTSGGNTEKEYIFSLTAKNCVFDTENLQSKTTLFTIGHNTALVEESVTLIGSNIYGDPSKVAFCKQNNTINTSFTHLKGDDGNYITNTRPTASATPDLIIEIEGKSMLFNTPISTEGEMTTYALGTDPLATPYGRIPEMYANDPQKYPILLFNTATGAVIWAGAQWGGETSETNGTVGGVLEALQTNCTAGQLAIYLQGNVTDATSYYNHGRTQGTHIIDLNGYTVTMSASASFLYAQAKATNQPNYTVSFLIKNGTINLGSSSLITIGSNTKTGNNAMLSNYTFENVTFENIAPKGSIVTENGGNFITTTNILFDSCSFYFTAGRTKALVSLGGVENFTVSVTVRGGSIHTEDTSLPVLFGANSSTTLTNRFFYIHRGENGFPTVSTRKNSTQMDDTGYETNLGVRYLVLTESTDTHSIYTFAAKTAYGYIPEIYEDTEKYPLLLIDPVTGTVLWAGAQWGGETSETNGTIGGVLEELQNHSNRLGRSLVIYLQADIESDSTFYNFGRTSYSHIIDLGGHTITSSETLFYAQAKNSTELQITLMNGTVVMTNSRSVVQFSSNNRASGKTMRVVFEGVTFKLSHRNASVISDSTSDGTFTAQAIFNNCTFEVANASLSVGIFYVGNSAYNSPIAITVNGGRFLFTSGAALPIFVNSKNYENHTVTFGKHEGNYPVVEGTKSLNTETVTFPGESGILGLYRTGETETHFVYEMSPLNFVSAYLNLTNELNLVYRVFVPYGYQSPAVTFTLGGRTVTVTAYTVDENGLYLFRLPSINPSQMGDTVTATLTALLGDEAVSLTHNTLSVKTYAEALKAQNAENTALVDLVDKLLVYGAAAQAYVGQTDGFVSEIGTPDAIPASENTLNMYGTENAEYAIVKLGMRLEGAFALRITVRAEDLDGLTLAVTKAGKTEHIDLSALALTDGTVTLTYDLVAHELSEQITFTLEKNGVAVGKTLTATANAYLYRISGGENSLSTLARAIYAYGKAAQTYAAQ